MRPYHKTATWLALVLLAAPAAAEEVDPLVAPVLFETATVLKDHAGAGATGAVGVNMAAGDNNLQANSAALAIGDRAAASTNSEQIVGPGAFTLPGRSETAIEGPVFNGATGWIGINQASGTSNAQSNSVAVAIGDAREVSGNRLAQVVAAPRDLGPSGESGSESRRTLVIGPEAFQGAEGVIQVNQSAGNGNATSNHFGLAVER